MKYTIALLLIATTAFASGDHGDHSHDGEGAHDHGDGTHEGGAGHEAHEEINPTELDVLENADYHMHLKYYLIPDKFGDNWLTFESTLEAVNDFTHHQYLSQWY